MVFSEEGFDHPHSLNTFTRVYLHGVIALAAFLAVAYLISHLVPLFDVTGNRVLAVVLAITVILLGPPLVGSLVLFGLLPLLGKRHAWRGILAWDIRLLEEITDAKEKARIVIINWPSSQVRTMGVLTSTIRSSETGSDMFAVYVPTAPQTRLGYIRVVAREDVEFTDWTLKQWQLYQFTFGAASPDHHTAAEHVTAPQL